MPKQAMHNLKGWMRDVRHAIDSGLEEAFTLAELIIELDGLILEPEDVAADGQSADDNADDAPDGNQGDLALLHTGASAQGVAPVGGPLARSSGNRTPASLLDGILDYVPGHLRAQAVAELDQLRLDALGASGTRLSDETFARAAAERGLQVKVKRGART